MWWENRHKAGTKACLPFRISVNRCSLSLCIYQKGGTPFHVAMKANPGLLYCLGGRCLLTQIKNAVLLSTGTALVPMECSVSSAHMCMCVCWYSVFHCCPSFNLQCRRKRIVGIHISYIWCIRNYSGISYIISVVFTKWNWVYVIHSVKLNSVRSGETPFSETTPRRKKKKKRRKK